VPTCADPSTCIATSFFLLSEVTHQCRRHCTESKGAVLTQTCSKRPDCHPSKTGALGMYCGCAFLAHVRIQVNLPSTNSWWSEGGQICCSKLMESCVIWQSCNRLLQLNGWLGCSGKLLQEIISLPFLLCESAAAIDSIIYCIFHVTGAIRRSTVHNEEERDNLGHQVQSLQDHINRCFAKNSLWTLLHNTHTTAQTTTHSYQPEDKLKLLGCNSRLGKKQSEPQEAWEIKASPVF